MSKSAGAASIKYLRESGKTKAEVFGMVGHLAGAGERISNWNEMGIYFLKE